MLMLGYSLALALGLLIASPWWLTRMFTTDRYREGLRERLGRVPAALREAAAGKRVIWLHAVSVGEVLAASRLVAELEATLGDGWLIAVSTTTRTGQQLAQERFGRERVFYFPLDFAFATRAYLKALKPAALILTESELWPRLLHECGRRKIPTVVVNARVSDRSYARAMKFRSLWRRVLGEKVTVFLAQSEQDAERLRTLGAAGVQAIGNLKYDVRAPKESRIAELIQEAAHGRRILVAGSTVGTGDVAEEQILLDVMTDETPTYDAGNLLLVLAPRHPERFDKVFSLIQDNFRFRASQLAEFKRANGFVLDADVILLDTIGDLAAVYSIADVAFIGGSLLKRGGHNPLEPAQFGIPVVMGWSYENFRGIVETMEASDAICIVQEPEQLRLALQGLLENSVEAKALGERGRQVFLAQQGASTRATEAILKLVRP